MTQLSDEILIAYADGELGMAQMQVVDEVLADDKVTQQRLERFKATSKRLSQAFSSMLQAEAKQAAANRLVSTPSQPPHLPQEVEEKTSPNILVPAVAAGILLVAVGAIGGYMAGNTPGDGISDGDVFATSNFWNKEQLKKEEVKTKALLGRVNEPKTTAATNRGGSVLQKRWYELVAARHKADAVHLLDQYDGKSRNRDLALFQFSKTDIAPTLIPILKEEELVFVGASPLKINGQNYARLAYRDLSNGAVPVGLYVGHAKGGSLTLERGYRGDDNYVRWTQGPRSYMLIGAVPHWRLIVLSVAVQRQLVQ
jgi:anti-sigma factor RsiW